MATDEEIGARLIRAREAAGLTRAQAAEALGIAYSTLSNHEAGHRGIGRNISKYTKRYRVTADWLLQGAGDSPKTKADSSRKNYSLDTDQLPNAKMSAEIGEGGGPVDVFGHAAAGDYGEFEFNTGNVLYRVMAPPSIRNIKSAYAVIVSGDSMSPRYHDGEIVFVDPEKRVPKGGFVVTQIQKEESGPILAYIKRFVSRTASELVLEQYNPPEKLRFDGNSVVSVHKIVLAGDPVEE